mmetsp:Transcript_8696/g.32059  ORF Transcript_8696/g.32059 Transcript_8696/m.32059 type:complete len:98 (+) Transcript_8696:192-485(+)
MPSTNKVSEVRPVVAMGKVDVTGKGSAWPHGSRKGELSVEGTLPLLMMLMLESLFVVALAAPAFKGFDICMLSMDSIVIDIGTSRGTACFEQLAKSL